MAPLPPSLATRSTSLATWRSFCRALKDWSPGLAGVELRHMAVFGPWAAMPRRTEAARLVGDDSEPRDPAAIIGSLIGGDKDYAYFIVHITAPSLVAAAGALGITMVGLLRYADPSPAAHLVFPAAAAVAKSYSVA